MGNFLAPDEPFRVWYIASVPAGGSIPALDIPRLIERCQAGVFKLHDLGSHPLELKDVNRDLN